MFVCRISCLKCHCHIHPYSELDVLSSISLGPSCSFVVSGEMKQIINVSWKSYIWPLPWSNLIFSLGLSPGASFFTLVMVCFVLSKYIYGGHKQWNSSYSFKCKHGLYTGIGHSKKSQYSWFKKTKLGPQNCQDCWSTGTTFFKGCRPLIETQLQTQKFKTLPSDTNTAVNYYI